MGKDYSKHLSELVSIYCPNCGSDLYSFSKPVIHKGSIILPCTCSNSMCKKYFTVAYKAYEIEFVTRIGKITIGLK